MPDFTYTTQRQYRGPAEWWYVIPNPYTPHDLARAQAAYLERFGVFPSTPRKLFTDNSKYVLLAYPIPTPPEIQPAPDQEPEFDPRTEQLQLPIRELQEQPHGNQI